MASISAPSYLHAERSPARLIFTDRSCSFPAFSRSPARSSRHLESTLCRYSRGDASSPSGSGRRRWDTMIQDVLRKAVKRWDDYVNRSRNSGQRDAGNLDALKEEKMGEEVEWDWDRWNKHFAEVEEQERLVDALKLQLRIAAAIEDYKEAVKLKAAITIATKNDAVGTAISDLNRAIAEERYNDAAFLRDHAGVGLMGWWAGISTNVAGAHGQIIHISAEHGRYVARSYSSRQLATARPGYPLFEIFSLNLHSFQAVYLKRNDRPSGGFQWEIPPKTKVSSLSPSDSSSDPLSDIYVEDLTAVEERDDDSDMVDGLAGIQNVLQDMIPGVKIKILKVVAPGKVDGDMISKVIEQIVEEEDEDNDEDLESGEAENSASETDNEDAVDSQDTTSDAEELLPEFPVKFVLKDIGELISSAIRQDQNKPFSGTMSFNRIELPSYADPLSGLYIGAHGIYASEILHLKRKFGQWQENDGSQRHDDLEFYEYVEALKLTGSLSVPAGQVVFRAKVGKKNQLPHKGIIPEEFGVVARYKGQGRFADTENQNPRWVDGELVILDGKLIKGGPVIGFVYWAPEYHFMVFFIQLKLPE
ncbi:hypothetical protein J5N97_022943 [Dioscorea zingiberensis]|uniref:Protein EXECUTER 1, chloroplastic n=1 Tax=Dioscorea zingiberensis TaxID=325984 RepID=A0A9D5HB25_9LILI|nr:hypothetical protein J5N97_022943 [Dioscorea zingiberensis]